MKKLLIGLSLAAMLTLSVAVFALLASMSGNVEGSLSPVEEAPVLVELAREPEKEEEEIIDQGPDLTGMAINPLTGHYIDEELAKRRPMAVVINNISQALPQSGIAQADIIYEVLAEGGITRLVAIFMEMDSEKIGPIRSTREYFLDIALNHDAILIHHGGSPGGYAAINNFRAHNLDGMSIARAFFRDPARASVPRMLEHSSYAIASGLFEEIESRGLRMEPREGFGAPFLFFEEDDMVEGEEVHEITVPFAPGSQVSRFDYLPDAGLYMRSQNNNPHMDEYTGQQLAVENVIIQYANMRIIDSEGRRDVTLVGSGRGVLYTRGAAVPVRWSCAGTESPTVWTFENGEPMQVSKGKTWICIMAE